MDITNMIGLLIASFVVLTEAQQPCGGHGAHAVPCTTVNPAEVNQAINDLHLFYNDDMCLELLLIDCATHVTQGDEVVCASNGRTYQNHCRFIHARCEYYLIAPHLTQITKLHSGACVVTTNAPLTASTATTGVAASATMAAITATGSTMADSTTALPVTISTGKTTTGINNIIQQLFCRNVDTVICSQDFSIVCGTDGQFYPNSCELSKAKCKDSNLTVESDSSKCTVPGK